MTEEVKGVYNLNDAHRMVFANLFEPKAVMVNGKPSGDPKYSANLLIKPDSPDFAGLRSTAKAVVHEKWPGRELKELAFPWQDGDKKADKDASRGKKGSDIYRGYQFFTSRTKHEPRLYVYEDGRWVAYEDEKRNLCKSKFYRGVLVKAQVRLVAYNGVGANPDGVNAYLNMVLSTGQGEKLSGGGADPTAIGFTGYVGLAKDEDPTTGEEW